MKSNNLKRKKFTSALAAAMVVMLVVVIGTGCSVLPGIGQNTGANAEPEEPTFAQGVFVDDIPLGGLTVQQARTKVEEKQKEQLGAINLELTHIKGNLTITANDVACSFDTDDVLNQAIAIAKTGNRKADKETIAQLAETPAKLTTSLTVDCEPAEQKVRDYAATLVSPGVDAAYTGFDPALPAGQQLLFTPDVPGTQVNPDKLWEQVKSIFATGNYSRIEVQDEPLPAAVTVADLQANLQLIGTFKTTIKNYSAPRLTNIDLVNKSVSGLFLQPGDTLSVNKLTGERSAAKGYKTAPVDQNGIEDVGLGGGACQVSGTLYNAAISAGPNRIKIVEREHHSLPSAYLKLGTDATVDYPNKDLQFTNISEKPMLVVMYFMKEDDGKYYEHANIYGMPDPEGATYQLEGIVVTALRGDPDAPVRMVPNNALEPGETKLIPARNGYVVDVYLVKTAKDGTVTKEKLYQDRYPASGPVLAYYAKDPKPSPTPIPSETPYLFDPFATPTPAVMPVVVITPAP